MIESLNSTSWLLLWRNLWTQRNQRMLLGAEDMFSGNYQIIGNQLPHLNFESISESRAFMGWLDLIFCIFCCRSPWLEFIPIISNTEKPDGDGYDKVGFVPLVHFICLLYFYCTLFHTRTYRSQFHTYSYRSQPHTQPCLSRLSWNVLKASHLTKVSQDFVPLTLELLT